MNLSFRKSVILNFENKATIQISFINNSFGRKDSSLSLLEMVSCTWTLTNTHLEDYTWS